MELEILLVQDGEPQVLLVQEALARWKTPYNLHVVSSAEDALEFLQPIAGTEFGNLTWRRSTSTCQSSPDLSF